MIDIATAVAAAFAYPAKIHLRRHHPQGYTDYRSFKPWLRDEFGYRCAYYQMRERWHGGEAGFSVDHYMSQASTPGRRCDYSNLIYACLRCNSLKGDEGEGIALDPCQEPLADHLYINAEGSLLARTSAGQNHIDLLQLDDPWLTAERRLWIQTFRDLLRLVPSSASLIKWLSYPDDLPNLRTLRPPGGNHLPDGVAKSAYELRRQGLLPSVY